MPSRPSRPRILVTNDDGIYSEGLLKLAEALRAVGDVVIVAPDREQSAASHALTLNRPLRLIQIEEDRYVVDGTPTDCVNLAVLKLLRDNRPDIVVSGVNFGPNLGDDVTYSGTISAAFEGALLNIPSIALSSLVGKHMSFDRCAAFGAALAKWVLDGDRKPEIILNVNFPVGDFAGVRVTKLGKRIYSEGVIERLDPRGRKYYWIGGEPPLWHPGEGTDFEAVQSGFVSITPLHLDLTHHESIQRLKPLEELLATRPAGNDAATAQQEREYAHQRALMVERHVAKRGVKDERVLQAMRDVPRHLFVPAMYAVKAYGPGALPIGAKQTISQPYIVGRMIELLELTGKEKVLEIGTGTGYQAVVLSRLAAKVFSIERINDLALRAAELIRTLKVYNASVKVFDGTYGWSDQAPFDRIIVAAAAPEVPEPLVQQLARTGRMVIPIGPEGNQRLARVTRVGTRVQIEDCGTAEFVPLVGKFGWSADG